MANDYSIKIAIIAKFEQAKKALADVKKKISGVGPSVVGMGKSSEKGAGVFTRAMDRMKKASASLGSVFGGLKSLAGGLFASLATISVGAIVGGIIKVNAAFEKLHASLVTVTGSTAAANTAFGNIKQFAKETPFQVEEITAAFIKLKALGLEPSMEALRSYGNTASAMGRSLDQFVEAIADAATGEFERLKEFGIKAKSEGDKVSFTFQGLTTTVGKNAKEIEEYLRGLGNVQFAGAMERQMDTINGAMSNLSDTFSDTATAIGEAGLNEVVKRSLQGLAGIINESKPAIAAALNGILAVFTITFSKIRIAFNVLTSLFGSVAVAISWTAEQILNALSAITFGDLSKGYAEMAKNMGFVTTALKKGVLGDLDDIKNATGDIQDAFTGGFAKKSPAQEEAAAAAGAETAKEKAATYKPLTLTDDGYGGQKIVDTDQAIEDLEKVDEKIKDVKSSAEGDPIKLKSEVDQSGIIDSVKAALAEAQRIADQTPIRLTIVRGSGGDFADQLQDEVRRRGVK